MFAAGRETRVVVVGAGPVGLLVAALLLKGPRAPYIKVRVLDSRRVPGWRPERTDLRVYALSRASQRLLEGLGLWRAVLARRASPYRSMRVWEGARWDGAGAVGFDSADIGEPDLGHIVEDALLRDLLLDLVANDPNAELSIPAALQTVRQTSSGVEIRTTAGETIAADVGIAADGGSSQMRAALGIGVCDRDYGQHAVVTHARSERPHAQTAWQRFLPGGPLAFLPLADGRSSIVWSLPSPEAERLTACSDAEFLAALQAASGGALGSLGPIDARASFVLRRLHALDYCRDGIALVGDAAHCVHPLAGQGMNLGFLDAACLAEVIAAAAHACEHPGDARVLDRYARRRKGHNLRMLLAFEGLDRLFRLPAWAAPLRELGLTAVERATPVKTILMRQAMGLDVRLPSGTPARVA